LSITIPDRDSPPLPGSSPPGPKISKLLLTRPPKPAPFQSSSRRIEPCCASNSSAETASVRGSGRPCCRSLDTARDSVGRPPSLVTIHSRMESKAQNAFRPFDAKPLIDHVPMADFYPPLSHPDSLSPLSANILGLIVSGDLGPLTIYTDRHGRKIAFPKSPPKKPPSPAQLVQRERFKAAQAAYMAITPEQKHNYELITKRLALCLTGQNLYIHVALSHAFLSLTTMERQARVTVLHPDPL